MPAFSFMSCETLVAMNVALHLQVENEKMGQQDNQICIDFKFEPNGAERNMLLAGKVVARALFSPQERHSNVQLWQSTLPINRRRYNQRRPCDTSHTHNPRNRKENLFCGCLPRSVRGAALYVLPPPPPSSSLHDTTRHD